MADDASWVAPHVERPGGSLVAGERELLQGLLAWHRATLLLKCAGLAPQELATRSVPPSNVSLLGLLRHLRKVERIWWRTRVAGEQVEPLHGFGSGRSLDFEAVDPASAQEDYEALLAEWVLCDRAVAGLALDDEFDFGQGPFSLRFVHLHLIGEYARHNGHADLVREHVDGVVGA
ncbi:MAG: DinB family protein [Humibacillus sp.]